MKRRISRAVNQRMYLIEMKDTSSSDTALVYTFSLLGSTGNLYEVIISNVPSCTCPDFLKGNVCKHIIFVYVKVDCTFVISSGSIFVTGSITLIFSIGVKIVYRLRITVSKSFTSIWSWLNISFWVGAFGTFKNRFLFGGSVIISRQILSLFTFDPLFNILDRKVLRELHHSLSSSTTNLFLTQATDCPICFDEIQVSIESIVRYFHHF